MAIPTPPKDWTETMPKGDELKEGELREAAFLLERAMIEARNATDCYGLRIMLVSAMDREDIKSKMGHYAQLMIDHVNGQLGFMAENAPENLACHLKLLAGLMEAWERYERVRKYHDRIVSAHVEKEIEDGDTDTVEEGDPESDG